MARIQNNIWWNLTPGGSQLYPPTNSVGYWVITNAVNNNLVADPLLRGISRTNVPAFGLDPRPLPNSPALTNSPTAAPNDGFYTPVTYSGAFNDINWASEWGYAAEACLISGEAAGTPLPLAAVVVPPNPVVLSAVHNGANMDITFLSQSGYNYQLQTRSDLTSGSWADTGSPVIGTGGTMTISVPIGSSTGFFQVRAY